MHASFSRRLHEVASQMAVPSDDSFFSLTVVVVFLSPKLYAATLLQESIFYRANIVSFTSQHDRDKPRECEEERERERM